jgi:hypothetical protein
MTTSVRSLSVGKYERHMRNGVRIGRSPVQSLELIATASWGGNACLGFWLLVGWRLREGRAVRITLRPPALALAHPALAIAGLLLWAVFDRTGNTEYGWCGFAVLTTSLMLGFVMLTRWLKGRAGRHARTSGERFPVRIVALHAAVGISTFTLVFIAMTLAMQHHP